MYYIKQHYNYLIYLYLFLVHIIVINYCVNDDVLYVVLYYQYDTSLLLTFIM